jgi:hypothetical protein
MLQKNGTASKCFASEHVQSGCLALAFGDNPVLDADLLAAVRIWPARYIACREDAGDARLQALVNSDAAVQGEAGLFRQLQRRSHTNAHDYEVSVDNRP